MKPLMLWFSFLMILSQITASQRGCAAEAGNAVVLKLQRTFNGSRNLPRVALSSDGSLLAVAQDGGSVPILEIATGEVRKRIPGGHLVTQVEFTPNDDEIVLSTFAQVRFNAPILFYSIVEERWPSLAGGRLNEEQEFFYPYAVMEHGDAVAVANVAQPGEIILWDRSLARPTGKLAIDEDDANIWQLRYSPQTDTLASTSVEGKAIRLWDPAKGMLRRELREKNKGLISCTQFMAEGKRLISGDDRGRVTMWDTDKGKIHWSTQLKPTGILDMALLANERFILCATTTGELAVLDVESGIIIAQQKEHTKDIAALAVNWNGSLCVSAGHDGVVKVWSVVIDGEKK